MVEKACDVRENASAGSADDVSPLNFRDAPANPFSIKLRCGHPHKNAVKELALIHRTRVP